MSNDRHELPEGTRDSVIERYVMQALSAGGGYTQGKAGTGMVDASGGNTTSGNYVTGAGGAGTPFGVGGNGGGTASGNGQNGTGYGAGGGGAGRSQDHTGSGNGGDGTGGFILLDIIA